MSGREGKSMNKARKQAPRRCGMVEGVLGYIQKTSRRTFVQKRSGSVPTYSLTTFWARGGRAGVGGVPVPH